MPRRVHVDTCGSGRCPPKSCNHLTRAGPTKRVLNHLGNLHWRTWWISYLFERIRCVYECECVSWNLTCAILQNWESNSAYYESLLRSCKPWGTWKHYQYDICQISGHQKLYFESPSIFSSKSLSAPSSRHNMNCNIMLLHVSEHIFWLRSFKSTCTDRHSAHMFKTRKLSVYRHKSLG